MVAVEKAQKGYKILTLYSPFLLYHTLQNDFNFADTTKPAVFAGFFPIFAF